MSTDPSCTPDSCRLSSAIISPADKAAGESPSVVSGASHPFRSTANSVTSSLTESPSGTNVVILRFNGVAFPVPAIRRAASNASSPICERVNRLSECSSSIKCVAFIFLTAAALS
ncbi:hypothetical protein D3C72_2161810 [compost metagenome]